MGLGIFLLTEFVRIFGFFSTFFLKYPSVWNITKILSFIAPILTYFEGKMHSYQGLQSFFTQKFKFHNTNAKKTEIVVQSHDSGPYPEMRDWFGLKKIWSKSLHPVRIKMIFLTPSSVWLFGNMHPCSHNLCGKYHSHPK